ncbi:MAG: hypothetical protein NVSMB18_32830 [Acetobacteraceae bacterium]
MSLATGSLANGLGRLLLVLATLPGCSLVDQTTFNPEAGKRPAAAVAAAAPAAAPAPDPRALLTIGLPITADIRPDLAKAVAAARARKPDVAFDVVEIVGLPDATLGADAATVARMIEAQGIPAARVQLAARPDPAATHQIRVYVR